MKRTEPGQVRVHRGFLRADGREALWPVEEVGGRQREDRPTPNPSRKREGGT